MKKIILGVLAASMAAFMWGAFYWMGPISSKMFQNQPNDPALRQVLKENLPKSGTYFVPNPGGNMEDYSQMHEQGPIALIQFNREGFAVNMGSSMLQGFLLNVVIILALAVLLKLVLSALPGYGKRVLFLSLVGFSGAFFIHVGGMIWWYTPITWSVIQFFYDLTVFVVIGLVLAAFIKPAQ